MDGMTTPTQFAEWAEQRARRTFSRADSCCICSPPGQFGNLCPSCYTRLAKLLRGMEAVKSIDEQYALALAFKGSGPEHLQADLWEYGRRIGAHAVANAITHPKPAEGSKEPPQ